MIGNELCSIHGIFGRCGKGTILIVSVVVVVVTAFLFRLKIRDPTLFDVVVIVGFSGNIYGRHDGIHPTFGYIVTSECFLQCHQ